MYLCFLTFWNLLKSFSVQSLWSIKVTCVLDSPESVTKTASSSHNKWHLDLGIDFAAKLIEVINHKDSIVTFY